MVKRFKLVDELGEGTMGRVFVAEDTVLKRHVALKLLPARFRDGRPNHRTERLIREARSAASLEHPNAVNVYEIDQSGGVHYIAMELAEGGNLENLVQLSGPMEVERACQLVAEAAEALAHAHKRGIIHRDIKPANLLLTRSGRCKLCDFGLALFDDTPDAEGRTRCVGTPNYIAPEIASGQGAGPASDLYSLGCTLFFMLTGRSPFNGTSAREVMKQHVNSPLPDLRRWRPDIPEKLASAVEKACAKMPQDRFDSADRFAKVLRTFTIPTGSSGTIPLGGSGAMPPQSMPQPQPNSSPTPTGSAVIESALAGTYLDQSAMPPVSAAQLAAIVSAPEAGKSRGIPAPMLWAGIGTIAAAALIGLGIWYSHQMPANVAVSSSPPAANAAPANTAAPAPAAAAVATGENVFTNGAIDDADDAGVPVGWYIAERCKPNVRALQEGRNRFMRLTNTDKSTTTHADQKVDLDPSWRAVTISARMRAANFKPTPKGSSGVAFSFLDENDKNIGKWPPVLLIKEDTPWTDRMVSADIPAGAKRLYLQCVISYATGTLDFDDVKAIPQK
jgi:serine/threonine protein kinase